MALVGAGFLETGIQGRPEWSSSWREESGSLFEAKNVAIKEDVSLKAEVDADDLGQTVVTHHLTGGRVGAIKLLIKAGLTAHDVTRKAIAYREGIAAHSVLSQKPAFVVEGPHVVRPDRLGQLTGFAVVDARLAATPLDQAMLAQE
jgi:hypothetical protein